MPRKLYTRISSFALSLLAAGSVCRMVLPQNAAASAQICGDSEFIIDYMVCSSEDAALTAIQTSLDIAKLLAPPELTEEQKESRYQLACQEYKAGLVSVRTGIAGR